MAPPFDLRDAQSVLTGAEVVTGADGSAPAIDRIVTAPRTGDLHDVGPGDLVITTTVALTGGGEPDAGILSRLRDAGIAGLAIRLDGPGPLDTDLLAAATEAAVAILTFPAQLGLVEVATTVADARGRRLQLEALRDGDADFEAVTLERLVAGDRAETEQVAERAPAFGWDLSVPRAVLLASIDPPADDAAVAGAITEIAAAARATLGPSSIVWVRRATVAVLLAPAPHDAADRRRLADGLRRELDRRVRTVTISIGVGRQVDDVAGLPDSFQEACRAVDVGRWAKGRHVTEVFDELGLERLFASTPQSELADFVRSAIGPLLDHDRTHHGDLVGTLESWLETRNIAESARRLHVHYNTFKNRLDRIEAILGPVIADAVHALECEVALYIARHYDGPWKRPPETP